MSELEYEIVDRPMDGRRSTYAAVRKTLMDGLAIWLPNPSSTFYSASVPWFNRRGWMLRIRTETRNGMPGRVYWADQREGGTK